jgi:hypothetical protein
LAAKRLVADMNIRIGATGPKISSRNTPRPTARPAAQWA